MITVNDTALNDNQLIFVAKITLDASYVYLSNVPNGITLSSHLYDASLVVKDSFTPISKNTNIISGGGIGDVASFAFQINNFSGYPTANINPLKYFPETSMPYLSGRKIEVGFVWEGATTEAEITTVYTGFIEQAPYTPGVMDIVTIEISELELIQLPYYELQADLDNGISYTTKIDEQDYGTILPILYGSFNVYAFEYRKAKLAPTVCFNKDDLVYKFSSHKCYKTAVDDADADVLTANVLFKYISDIDSYLILIPDNGSNSNTNSGAITRLLSATWAAGEFVMGRMFIVPTKPGVSSDVTNVKNIYDYEWDGTSTVMALADTKKASVVIDGQVNSGDAGVFQNSDRLSNTTDVYIWVTWQSDNGGNRALSIQYYNPNTNSYSTADTKTTTQTGGNYQTDSSNIGADNFSTDEFGNYEWVVSNDSTALASAGSLNVAQVYLELKNLIAFAVYVRPTQIKMKYTQIQMQGVYI